MALAVALFGAFVVVIGVTGLVSPPRLAAFVGRWRSQMGLTFAAGIRLLLGIALLLAAPDSRAPLYLQVFGGLALVAAVALPLLGQRRFDALIDWWVAQAPATVRLWCLVALAVGASFVWAVFPESQAG